MSTLSSARSRRTQEQQRQERRIVDAASAEFVRAGVRRASIDRIARDAGVSRSTLYRRFPSKEALLTEVVLQLQRDFFTAMENAVGHLDPRQSVIEGFQVAIARARSSDLVKRIIADEPGAVDLIIGLDGPNIVTLVDQFSARIVESLRSAGANMPDADLRLAAETMFRLIMSYALTSSHSIDIDDPDALRDYAAKFLAPMVW
ncbi:TetR/AcrR family transcriptional regulator [Gordonia otitidis]|uniref:TetR/AcrR family transcriptional regulator n=1 Tax=Gordonia otitidis TaxID=249058 RepID=UPI001D143800|nr:TetR/AcrR family transcriptional regulator [Gordonia otitidis]UEA57907.1 TetR/AcrR family transcriptional regulator [Gordonia otitidis]